MRGVALLLVSSLLSAAFSISSDVASIHTLDHQSDKHAVEQLVHGHALQSTQQQHPNDDKIAAALRDNFNPQARAVETLRQHSPKGSQLHDQDAADEVQGADEGVHRFIGGQIGGGLESKSLVDADSQASEGMEVSVDGEMEPISMGVMAGAKAIAVAAQLVFTIATARKAASIEMAGKQTEKIAAELEEELTKLEKFLSEATSEASVRLGDAVVEISDMVVSYVGDFKPESLVKFASGVKSLASVMPPASQKATIENTAPLRQAIRAKLQEEYDMKLGLGGGEVVTDPNAYIMVNAMPLMSALQDVLIPVTDDQLEKQFNQVLDKVKVDAKNPKPVGNAAAKTLNLQRNALLSARSSLIATRKKSSASALITGLKGTTTGDVEQAKKTTENINAMIDANNEALRGQFEDFGNDMLNDGPDVAAGLEKSKGMVRLFNGFEDMDEETMNAEMTPISEALAVLSAAQALWSVYNAFKVMRTAEYEAWRRVGVAKAASEDTIQDAEYNICRLLVSLYGQLRKFAELPKEQVLEVKWERLVEGPMLDALQLSNNADVQTQLRAAIHGKLCSVFYPLRRRLGAYFRNNGKCTMLNNFKAAAKKTTSFAQVDFNDEQLEKTSNMASVLTCHDRDIYDMRLVTAKEAAASGQGWETIESDSWKGGELNAELSVNFLRRWVTDAEPGKPQKPEWSRVLQVRRCPAIFNSKTKTFNIDISDPKNSKLLTPITDLKVVIRTADSLEGPCKTEVDLMAGGYELVEFAGAPSKVTSLSAELKKGNKLFTWWDGVAFNPKYSHTEPSDLNFMMMEKRPPLFLYARRGVTPTPLREVTILPFLAPGVTSASKVSFVVEMNKDFTKTYKEKNGLAAGDAKPAVGASYEFPVDDVIVPPGAKNCKIVGRRTLTDIISDEKKGIKHSIVRYITYRKWKGTLIDETTLELETVCNDEGTAERWQRVAVSPYEGSWDDGVLRMLYFWIEKSYADVKVPDTTKTEIPCPDMCSMRKGNTFLTTEARQNKDDLKSSQPEAVSDEGAGISPVHNSPVKAGSGPSTSTARSSFNGKGGKTGTKHMM